jgi:meso-butanediol dehydrogenase/(S,S)-butanediol dehydrogenase/diacetyl reductase
MARLQDKVVIVTGGAQGLGEGIARRLAEEGASLVIADINGAKAQSVADSLVREGRQAIAVLLDVAERKQTRDAVQKTVEHFGRLDVMFNNAGFNRPLPFMDERNTKASASVTPSALAGESAVPPHVVGAAT